MVKSSPYKSPGCWGTQSLGGVCRVTVEVPAVNEAVGGDGVGSERPG